MVIELVKKGLETLKDTKIDVSNIQQRGIGDKIEDIVCEFITKLNTTEMVVESATSRRSMEDIQILNSGCVYKFDTKSHNVDSDFSMPNLVSIDRLKRFYNNDRNFLCYIFVDYKVDLDVATIVNIDVRLIEELHWDILAIQNLGKGQLQIKNMNNELKFVDINRTIWMDKLKENAVIYYDNLINKIKRYKRSWE
jgi:hypothetical protein